MISYTLLKIAQSGTKQERY